MAQRVRLGELLVDAKIVTREQLDEILERQQQDGRRLGTLVVEAGLVSETQVTQILSQQLSVPWVNLYHTEFSSQLLELVSQELAEQHRLVPIFVRRIRGLGNTLYVAMEDPTNEQAREEVEKYSGLPVRAMIAPPSDIASAIRVYYGGAADAPYLQDAELEAEDYASDAPAAEGSDADDEEMVEEAEMLEESSVQPRPAAYDSRELEPVGTPPADAAAGDPSQLEAAGAHARDDAPRPDAPSAQDAVPPASVGAPKGADDTPELEYQELELTERRRRAAERATARAQAAEHPPARTITLTLLDGTTVTIPAPGGGKLGPRPAPAPKRWTARDLVAALEAPASASQVRELLGEEVRWEALLAALLKVLMNKHLVADWEFVEAYQKQANRKPG